jgi:hypothetical protein
VLESARRLFIFGLDKGKTPRKEMPRYGSGAFVHQLYTNAKGHSNKAGMTQRTIILLPRKVCRNA